MLDILYVIIFGFGFSLSWVPMGKDAPFFQYDPFPYYYGASVYVGPLAFHAYSPFKRRVPAYVPEEGVSER